MAMGKFFAAQLPLCIAMALLDGLIVQSLCLPSVLRLLFAIKWYPCSTGLLRFSEIHSSARVHRQKVLLSYPESASESTMKLLVRVLDTSFAFNTSNYASSSSSSGQNASESKAGKKTADSEALAVSSGKGGAAAAELPTVDLYNNEAGLRWLDTSVRLATVLITKSAGFQKLFLLSDLAASLQGAKSSSSKSGAEEASSSIGAQRKSIVANLVKVCCLLKPTEYVNFNQDTRLGKESKPKPAAGGGGDPSTFLKKESSTGGGAGSSSSSSEAAGAAAAGSGAGQAQAGFSSSRRATTAETTISNLRGNLALLFAHLVQLETKISGLNFGLAGVVEPMIEMLRKERGSTQENAGVCVTKLAMSEQYRPFVRALNGFESLHQIQLPKVRKE